MALPPAQMASPAAEEEVVETPVLETTDAPVPLVTIARKNMGDETGYIVYEGAMPSAPAEGEAPVEGMPADSLGAALKAAMDILQADEEASEGETAESNFAAGFEGGSEASPKKSAPMV